MTDYTLVCGVDRKHLEQLKLTLPTWMKHKPSIFKQPVIIFYDREQVCTSDLQFECPLSFMAVPWPPKGLDIEFSGDEDSKWSNPQRYKMLSGFVHVPAALVSTRYWLKLDCDVVATEMDDWIDDDWFKRSPAIVSAPWGFTKPPDQMVKLDEWGNQCLVEWGDSDSEGYRQMSSSPLNLTPELGADRLRHPRIISWCAFFDSMFTRKCADLANRTCTQYQLPVPSQDGFLWYMATRLQLGVVRPRMKRLGWEHWSTMRNIRKAVGRAMA